jgi:citrate synthase
MPETLTVTDNRTGKRYELPISDGAIRATDLRQIKAGPDDGGLMTYDPAYKNTAACKSRITYIDGDKGILEYRGYPIDQLAERSTFLETAHLIIHGELPGSAELAAWTAAIGSNRAVPPLIKNLMSSFARDAHPMGMYQSAVAALSTFYPDAKDIGNEASRRTQTHRMVAQMPTLAALAFRHGTGQPAVNPDPAMSFTGNFLNMLFKADGPYRPDPVLERALDVLFILHADHEQNCSTSTMRAIGSSRADPYAAMAGAVGALYGPLHGGANEAVLRMLTEIQSVDRVPEFITHVKAGERRLMGFGHRVYKSYDPRAKIVKEAADSVFAVTGTNPLLDVALELERIALQDDYFVSRKLYPNVDFYSGLIYKAMGFPSSMFPVLFALARTVGWAAQWLEMVVDPDQKIARPLQVYLGASRRDYVPVNAR